MYSKKNESDLFPTSSESQNQIHYLFWPLADHTNVHSISLNEQQPHVSKMSQYHMFQICRLADAIRSLQDVKDENVFNIEIQRLKMSSAKIMKQLSRTLTDENSIKALLFRARNLELSHQIDEQAILSCNELELFSFCGELSTWHAKSKKLFYSSFFAKIDNECNELVHLIDSETSNGIDYIKQVINQSLRLSTPLPFKVGNLIECGGEANRFPKHFSYFLPEDEGIKFANIKKTIVFKNIYIQTYQNITELVASQHLNIAEGKQLINTHQLSRHLLAWFRGHDISHGIHIAQTNFKILKKFGKWFSMEAQEVIADCFGFLFALSKAWQDKIDLNTNIQCQIFISELLRYLHKGCDSYPDSGAAFIELMYLHQNGFINVDFMKAKVNVSCSQLVNGMISLANALIESVLSNNEHKLVNFYQEYSWEANLNLLNDVKRQFSSRSHVLNYVSENYI